MTKAPAASCCRGFYFCQARPASAALHTTTAIRITMNGVARSASEVGVIQIKGANMRKVLLVLGLIAFAAMTTTADAAKKSKRPAPQAASPDASVAGYYDNTGRFIRDALPVFLPSWSMPLYVGMQPEGSTHGPKPVKRGTGQRAKR
jgi:hypothetical protein